jgi:hypothetical protein
LFKGILLPLLFGFSIIKLLLLLLTSTGNSVGGEFEISLSNSSSEQKSEELL